LGEHRAHPGIRTCSSFLRPPERRRRRSRIAPAPVDDPKDPIVQLAPSGVAPPEVTAGSYVYRAPDAYSFAWTLNGATIAGANSEGLKTTGAGPYACRVTASDQAGSATQTSAGFAVQASAAPPPSNATTVPSRVKATVRLGKLKRDPEKGTATILAPVSGPGTVTLRRRTVVAARMKSRGVGVVKLKFKAKGKARSALKLRGKAAVKAKVTFAPSGGGASVVETRAVVLKKKP
jgi:hypothetical protein